VTILLASVTFHALQTIHGARTRRIHSEKTIMFASTHTHRQQFPLTLDRMQILAPSAFATEAHASRSNRYAYIPTSNVIEGMMRAGFQPYAAKQGRSRVAGKAEFTKHLIRFRHESISTQMQVGDTLPEIVLINSHDDTSAYKLMAGLFRLVCSNGLMVADRTLEELTVQHKGNVQQAVIDGSVRLLENAPRAMAQVSAWQNLQLTAGEQTAFAEAAHTLRFADAEGEADTPITAAMLLGVRRSADQGADMWRTLNRVQENVIRGGLSARAPRRQGERIGRRVTTREVRGIDQDVRLNRALWQLAERMQELKGARQVA
jgi:hypothetical protein